MKESSKHVINLYDRNAIAWDEARNGGRHEGEKKWVDKYLSILPPDSSILDIGCGSGAPIARDLLAAGHKVTGVDSSPNLISICKDRYPNGTWITADMRKLQLSHQFGGIIAWHSLFHLTTTDQVQMFNVLESHAAPGAALMFTSGPERGESIGCWQGEALYHASLAPAEYRALLAHHGFSLVDHVANDPDCGGATVWLAKISQ